MKRECILIHTMSLFFFLVDGGAQMQSRTMARASQRIEEEEIKITYFHIRK